MQTSEAWEAHFIKFEFDLKQIQHSYAKLFIVSRVTKLLKARIILKTDHEMRKPRESYSSF